jgi:protein-S-isoprenylcysteine O-methyltransferase Ste14
MNEVMVYNWILISWFILSVIVFIVLFFIVAPYGRHSRRGWGPSLNNRLGWLVMEAPAALLFIVFYFIGNNKSSLVLLIFILLWEAHYIHRAFIYPASLPKSKYGMPVSVIVLGFFFNMVNCYINGRYLFTFSTIYTNSWFMDPRFIFGVIIFIAGFVINRISDSILRRLRDENSSEYQIPQGGMYQFVSSPNYLGEILIWVGWAVATWSLAGLAFAVWTIANLVPRAWANHKWYHERFDDYPAGRKALIPGIW